MKPYEVTVDVTTRWTMEIHANDETEAQQFAEDVDTEDIEAAGDCSEVISIEAVDVIELDRDKED